MGKIGKYYIYVVRFINSSNKSGILKDLVSEIKDKGLLTGMRSLLHKKSHFHYVDTNFRSGITAGRYNDNDYAPEYYDGLKLSIKEYDTSEKVVLPKVSTPKVSIIVPMYNEVDYTYNCVRSIKENNDYDNYEVIIADDKSPDNTDILRDNIENLVIIRNEENLGFLRNCNHAATKARGEYIVLLNNDTQVQKDWLVELLAIFDNYKDAGLVGSKLLYPDGTLQEAGGIIWQDGSACNFGNRDNPEKPQYNYVKEADYISGASIMIPTKLWNELGGFDEFFLPAYCEDSDLCFRVRKSGYKVVFQPFSVVVHFEGVSHGTDLTAGIKKHQVINQQKFKDRWKDELKLKAKNAENFFGERDRTSYKKHVLVVDHYLPQIDKDAGSRTIANFMDCLQELDYSVIFLGENSNTSKQYQIFYQEKGVEVLYGNKFNFTTKNWKHYLNMNLDNFDAILLSRAHVCMPIMAYLRNNKYKGNIIYYGHDLGFLRVEKDAIQQEDASLLKVAKKLKANEDYMYSTANNSLAINTEEIAFLKEYITKPIHYIPPYFFEVATDGLPFDRRSGILFVGGFNHPPNQDAMRWFLDEIYEPLDKQGIVLTIVGSKMPEFIFKYKERFKSLNIVPDAPVELLNELYTQARIAIVPLTSGAGVKGKVIEAMAKGVPVVGTDVAFEGMPKDANYLYKGANTAQEMIDGILAVYDNKQRWEQLSEFGKQYVRDNFNKAAMRNVFKKIIEG